MTDVYTPPANSTLGSSAAPVAVVADHDVDSISVSYGPFRSTETVYLQGVFCYPFLRSTRTDARTFSIVRDDGWPSPPLVWVNDPSGFVPASLQPLTDSPYAAWTLEELNGVSNFADRSGNGRTIPGATIGAAMRIASPVPAKAAVCSGGTQAGGYTLAAPIDPAHLASTGFTLCFWMLWAGVAANGYNVSWPIGWTTDNNVWLPWFVQQGTATSPSGRVGYSHDGSSFSLLTDLYMSLGLWSFCSLSVAPSGAAEFGIDGVYESHSSVTMGNPPTTTLSLLSASFTTNFGRQLAGALFDMMIWDTARSRTQNEFQRTSAKGSA